MNEVHRITRRSDPTSGIYRDDRTRYKVQRRRSIIAGLFFLFTASLFAQQQNLPLNREWSLEMGKKMLGEDSLLTPPPTLEYVPVKLEFKNGFSTFTGLKPLLESNSYTIHQVYGYKGYNYDRGRNLRDIIVSPDVGLWVKNRGPFENLISIKDTAAKFRLTIDPLFDLTFGKDRQDKTKQRSHVNTRGLLVRGDLGSKFSFETSFYENQAFFPSYIDSFNLKYGVVPGQGRWKTFYRPAKGTADSLGYDYATSSANVSYSPSRHFNFQVGHGKHFVGDGYRSLLLSDNSSNYPFFRLTSTFGRFQYTNLYTAFMNLVSGAIPLGTEHLYQKKAGVFQFLSVNLHKRVQLGLFQGTIAPGGDDRNEQHLEPFFFNPFIFANAGKYSLRDPYNVLVGATLKLKITSHILLYGQYMIDDVSKDGSGSVHNKQGFQAGLKYFDAFTIKDLHLQLEYNQVRPYAYSKDTLIDAWTHLNQPLAHPLGANFFEFVSFINYHLGPFFTEFRISYAIIGRDSAGYNFGSDVFKSSEGAYYGPNSDINVTGQGMRSELIYSDLKVGWLINPAVNTNLSIGFTDRNFSNKQYEQHLFFIYISLRTSLLNHYYDF
jgi:hypothetical protein